jgi:hypothetical protein
VGVALALVKKNIFVVLVPGMSTQTCEVHPAIAAHEQQLLPVLKQACDSRSDSPVVTRHGREWTMA